MFKKEIGGICSCVKRLKLVIYDILYELELTRHIAKNVLGTIQSTVLDVNIEKNCRY